MPLDDRQIMIIITIGFAAVSIIIEIIRTIIKKKFDFKTLVYIAISGAVFGWALFYGYKIIEFFYFGKYKTEYVPEDLVLNIVLGSLALLLGSVIIYLYGMGLQDWIKGKTIKKEANNKGAKLNKKKIMPLFKLQLDEIENLWNNDDDTAEFQKWYNTTETLILEQFGKDSHIYRNFKEIQFSSPYDGFIGGNRNIISCREGLEKAKGILQSIIEILNQ